MQKEAVLDVHVKANRQPRFKAGADISGKVNRMVLEIDQTMNGDKESVAVKFNWVESSEASDCDIEM